MIDQPIGRFDAKTGRFEVMANWSCQLSIGLLEVDAGFKSDGASIPKPLQSFVSPRYEARTFPAALAHDALYAGELVDRHIADREFYRLLKRMGVNEVKARIYYTASRVYGRVAYRKHTPESVENARKLCRIKEII